MASTAFSTYYPATASGQVLNHDFTIEIYLPSIHHHKTITMQKQKTIYQLIVDKSGSMSDCIDNTINGFNEQVNKITELEKEFPEHEITIGLTSFNHEVYHNFFYSKPKDVRKLNKESYIPSGSTAFLDAIGKCVAFIEKDIKIHEKELNTTVVVVILTDGYENASGMFKLDDIRKSISRLEETGKWTFSFIGATLDAVDVAASMNIKTKNSFSFEKENMNNEVWNKLSDSMGNYMNKKDKGRNLDDMFSK